LNKIDENWDLFEHKTKIMIYLKKLNKNLDQKGILTYKLLIMVSYESVKTLILLGGNIFMSSSCGVGGFFMNELCYTIMCYMSYMLICLLCDVIHG